MSAPRTMRAAVVGALLGSLAVAGMVGSAYSAPVPEARATHRAAVIVDGYAPRCITFDSDSVSGTQALQLAGFSATLRSFSGEGGAVCAINGTGCSADANCLTCAAPNYWAYFRADSGAGGFTYSNAGASSTQVTDGDVEGWRWGTGAAPAYVSFAEACPLQPPPTPTTRPPSGGNTGGGNTGGGGNNGGGGATGAPSGGSNGGGGTPGSGDQPNGSGDQPGGSATTVAPTTTEGGQGRGEDEPTSGEASDTGEDVDGEEAASLTPIEGDDGGGGPWTWVAFAALLGGLGLVGWRVRRTHARPS